MKIEYIIWSSVCLISLILRTVYNIMKFRKHPVAQNKIVTVSTFVIMGIFWFSWFQMCFYDPVKMDIPNGLRYSGLTLFIGGVLLLIFSYLKIRGIEAGEFARTGIYSRFRNPMYLGFIIWVIGFPVFLESLVTLISSIVWISFFIQWKWLEEKELEKKYPGYREYKKSTWF